MSLMAGPSLKRISTAIIGATALTLLSSSCSYEERKAELLEMKEEIKVRAEALSSWADELEAQDATITAKEDDLLRREAEVREQRAKVEAEAAALNKLKDSIESKAKTSLKGSVPSIVGKYAIVVDIDTGIALYEKNAGTKTAVASTQKLMTALLTVERGDLDVFATVAEVDTRVSPTKLYIKPGEQYARRDLMRALLVRSGNDLAMCLARDHSGSKQAFAERMTERARELGMMNTKFLNPHGLTETGQYSTASDMAKLAIAAYSHPEIRECTRTHKTIFEMGDGTKKTLVNTNRVLRDYGACDGMKTGYTIASGFCLITSGCRDEKKRIIVVLGSSSRSIWTDSRKLLEWALKV